MIDKRDAIEQVYRREARRMLGYIRQRVANSEEAEDILQEAFAAAVQSPNVFQETDRLAGWVYRVIRNRIIDRHRRDSRWRALAPRLSAECSLEQTLTEWQVDVADKLDRDVAGECLARCIRMLPVAQREVYILSELQGRSFSEIESRFPGVPRNTLIWRKHAAVRRLRRWLREMLA